ncbi:UDP-GlcNAc:undecaprenyl-phosphate GlcNAc-1-phosphate transferase [Pedobacter sp. UYEF25]
MAGAIVRVIVPTIISFSVKYNLFDRLDLHRKDHKGFISRLGGVAIFASFTITVLFFSLWIHSERVNFLLVSCFILGALGLKDDLHGASLNIKLFLQIGVSVLLVFFGGYHLKSLYGVLNIGEVSHLWGCLFSVLLIIFLSNIFNLIDGIDGLAASVGLLVSVCFGILFATLHQASYALISFTLFGTMLGFLKFNWSPAKIFMGDAGSLIIGLITSVLAIKFIELNKVELAKTPMYDAAPAIAVSILIVPIFDSLRIFTVRILNRHSPFRGDRNHMHHRLGRLGFTTTRIVFILVVFNALFVTLVFLLQNLGNFMLMCLMIITCALFNFGITLALKRKTRLKEI